MESMIHTQTLSDNLVHQQHHLKEAVSLAIQQDNDMFIKSVKEAVSLAIQQETDMFIVSKDKTVIPCHRFLLALFSPVVARLLSGFPCCSSPTIFLPDFPALHIKKLLHLLRSGQAIPGKNENIDINMVKQVAEVLQVSIIDLNLGPWLDNPLGVPFAIKTELRSFNVKKEIDSFEEEKKVINLKQESESYNEELEGKVKQAEKEPCEYIERDSWMTPVNFETIAGSNVKTILAAEQDQNGDISTGKEPKEVIMESSNDMVIREAADIAFEDKQMLHDWYEQAEESENMILDRNIDDKDNIIPDLAKQTKSFEDTVFQCFLCPMTFTSSSQLRRHTKSHMDEKQFPRPVCSKISSQMGSLNKLDRIHVEEEQGLLSSKKNSPREKVNRDKFYKCAICSKSFSNMLNLKQHNITHTGEKPYHCIQCPQSFSRPSDLKRHKTIHTGVKSHQCDLCPKSFSLMFDLKRHKMIHTGEKPYQCHLCPKSFSLLYSLRLHKMTHTGEKPHQCDECSKSFSQLCNFKLHKMTHSGKKPYQCAQCSKSFSQLIHLKSHNMIHTGEKPYKCEQCPKAFPLLSNLRRHEKIHNGEKRH